MESTTSQHDRASAAISNPDVADPGLSRDKAPSRIVGFLQRLARNQSLRSALFVFILTRGLILAIMLLVGVMSTAPDVFPGHFDSTISLHKSVPRALRSVVLTADINWYLGIAEHGYERLAYDNAIPHNWAFFPLFPLVVHLASYVTGEVVFTGMFVSHLCFLIALFFLHRIALLFGFSLADADRSVFYLAVFPTSYFFSLPLSEAMFLMCVAGSFYFARSEKWLLAGLCGALASGSRITGVLLLPALAVLYWEMYRPIRNFHNLKKSGLALLLIPAGLLAFMIHLRGVTGNYFAFAGSQAAWGRRPRVSLSVLTDYLLNPADIAVHWDFRLLNFIAIVLVLTCAAVLLKKRHFALALYSFMSAIIALSSGMLQSQARYAMVLFPIYLILGMFGRNGRVDQVIRTISITLLGILTALFAAHYTFALS